MRLRVALSAGPLRLCVGGIGGTALAESRPASRTSKQPAPASYPHLWGSAAAAGGGDSEAPSGATLRNPDGSAVPGRMVFFVKGAAVTEAGDALGDIAPGQVVLCPSIIEHIPRSALLPANRSMRRETVRREALQREQSSSPTTPRLRSHSGADSAGGGRGHSHSPLVVGPTAGAPLADYCRNVLGVPSGSLAGRLREAAPPLETPEQVALASLFVPYTASAVPGSAARAPGRASTKGEARGRAQVRARLNQIASLGAVDPARYLAEFRPVSVLFGSLKIAVEEEGGPEGAAPRAVQRAVRTVQALLYAHQGSLRQIVLDDKGLVVIGVFGLYPISHEDDAARSAACALDVREAMEAAGVACAIGLATGLAFCAFVGDPATRCEFSVFGNAVNRAARLMGKAAVSGAGVLADGETRAAAGQQVEMDAAGEYHLKGIPGPTAAHRPLRVRGGLRGRRSRAPSIALGQAPEVLYGREEELAVLRGLLEAHAAPPATPHVNAPSPPLSPLEDGPDLPWPPKAPKGPATAPRPPSLVVAAGDTGLGKSALARAAAGMAAVGWRAAATAALSTQRQPLAAWRPLLAALFPQGILEARPAAPPACRASALASVHVLDPAVVADLEGLLPPRPAPEPAPAPSTSLPKPVSRRRPSLHWIPASPPPAEDAGPLSPPSEGAQRRTIANLKRVRERRTTRLQLPDVPAEVRAAQLRAAVVRLVLSRATSRRPLLVVFEGAPPVRPRQALPRLTPPQTGGGEPATRLLLLVTCRRPGGGAAAAEPDGADLLAKLAAVPGQRWLELQPLDCETVARLACARIGAASLPADAATFIASESGGVPFIAADLAERLREEGTLCVDTATGACTVARPLHNPRPSDGLRSALLWRLDRLGPSQLFTVKLASIVGMRFSAEEVAAILPHLQGGNGVRSAEALRAAARSLAGDLAALCGAGILRETVYEAAAGETFEFALSPMREVVHGLLPVAERRRLHRAFAQFLEECERELDAASRASDGATAGRPSSRPADAEGSSSGLDGAAAELLAYHWTAAEEPGLALPYLERCAAAALDSFANSEAEHMYSDLLARYPGASPFRRAGWLAGLAEVGSRTGRYPSAVKHCREALALLGVRIPSSRLGVWGTIMLMAVQARLRPPPSLANSSPEKLAARCGTRSSRQEDARDVAIADLFMILRQATGHSGDGALFLYSAFGLWRHAQDPERSPGPRYLAIASALVASNMTFLFPRNRSLATAYAKFGFKLGSDTCTGAYVSPMHRAVEEFYRARFSGGFVSVAAFSRAFFLAGHSRALLSGFGPHAPAPGSALSAVARQAVELQISDRTNLAKLIGPDVVCEAATVLFVAWLVSAAPAARSHPAAPFARLYPCRTPPLRRRRRRRRRRSAPASWSLSWMPPPATARNGTKRCAAGAAAVLEGLALSARGAVRAARERFLAAAALGGWTAPTRLRRRVAPATAPSGCSLRPSTRVPAGAWPAPPASTGPAPKPQSLRRLERAERPGPELLKASRAELLAAAERCFGLYSDAIGARIAREAARI
eukprot:tig00020629_g12322.t1